MLQLQNVSGGYARIPVIQNIQFAVQPGEMVGLIGLNGAGKSTTIKHILGLLTPLSGEISLDGKRLVTDPAYFRPRLAYIPETPQFYEELTLQEHLTLTASAYQLSEEQLRERGEHLLKLFHMDDKRDWFPSVFSKGMQQKLMILTALLIESPYLIIDEPFVGLDPLAIQALLELLQQRKAQGTGILLSTHILDMAEKYCDHFVLLHRGQVHVQGTLAEMRQALGQPDASLEQLFIQVTEAGA
jgi:ABC-2 type transport system ATP-binding protein